jgi:hypothetical protein
VETKPKEHPLETVKVIAALAVAAIWGLGVSLIDPRTGVGVILCLVAVAGTVWLYYRALKQIPVTPWRAWPWLGFVFIVGEILVPIYMLAVRVESSPAHSVPAPPAVETPPKPVETSPSQSTPLDRVVVDVTPEYLLDFYRDRMVVESERLFRPFVGKWIKVSGTVADIAPPNFSTGSMIVVFEQRNVFMHFDEKLFSRVETLRRGQQISLMCQISTADRIGIRLQHCEFQN